MQPNTSTRTWPFFLIVFAITALTQGPAALASAKVISIPVDQVMGLVGLGILAPFVSAMIVARWNDGKGAIRALFRQLLTWRTHVGWYALALLGGGCLLVLGSAAYHPFGGDGPSAWWMPPREPQHVAALFIVSFFEEIGWRGFALPRMQAKYGPVKASLLLGALWCIWHIPMFVVGQDPWVAYVCMLPFFVGGSVYFTWLYNRSKAGLCIAIVAHMGAHLNNSTLGFPGNSKPFVIHTIMYTLAAACILIFDRRLGLQTSGHEGTPAS